MYIYITFRIPILSLFAGLAFSSSPRYFPLHFYLEWLPRITKQKVEEEEEGKGKKRRKYPKNSLKEIYMRR